METNSLLHNKIQSYIPHLSNLDIEQTIEPHQVFFLCATINEFEYLLNQSKSPSILNPQQK